MRNNVVLGRMETKLILRFRKGQLTFLGHIRVLGEVNAVRRLNARGTEEGSG